jgi:hypothetical protein
LNEPNFN